MASASPADRILRFGIFEVDLAARELRKKGRRVRLQEQPFQMLALLLERPGEVVTREELRQKLWPADTFVDFDHSLNTAIKKVREALGDSAASPLFVETLARRGYRFVAPVEQPQAMLKIEAGGIESRREFHPELEVPLPHRGMTRGLFGLIQAMYLIFYVVALFRLAAIDQISGAIFSGWRSVILPAAVIVTAGIGLPLRCYLFSAVLFDYRRLGEKFRRLFLPVLILDLLWATAPFLLAPQIGFGAAFGAMALLVYVPFAERTLVKMAYRQDRAGQV
jgi:cholera toxin transcriptional activator